MVNLRLSSSIKIVLAFLIITFCIMLVGCTVVSQPQKSPAGPLGVYRSEDSGLNWVLKSSILNTQGKVLTLGDVSVSKILMDPNEPNTLFLATDKGLWYSLTTGEGWQQIPLFGSNKINDVAVDYFNKCNVFVVAGQSIYRTTDCLRTWVEVYVDTRQDLQITQIAADHYNKTYVYAANNKGEVLKSVDSGKTWQTIKRVNNSITQLLIDRDDSRIIYAITQNAGIYKTADAGKTWSDEKPETDINRQLDKFSESKNKPFLLQDRTKKNSYLMASKYGLLRTTDGGMKWEAIKLITPERSANIYALASDPTNAKIIYYSTENTIYKSTDGGLNWATQKSPTGGIPNFILINPKDAKVIYLGAKEMPKK
ncbi:hypothetical protein JW977_01040 [Candidatus Falkowbacteria bacterium]|nr:hypothetical protein [Candidatus Falkowbacteria bacterium]